jgi:hypothetical protein
MSERTIACTRCRTTMEPGFVLDQTYGAMAQSDWVAGKPERSFWTGLTVKGRERLPVTTYRCPKCGYLESYASAGA